MRVIPTEEPLAVTITAAIRAGEIAALKRLLVDNPGLALSRLGDEKCSRTLLHVATDWPGHILNGAAVVAALIEAGAEVDARFVGASRGETPLHWAASSDDIEVLDALLDAGADIEAPGAVIGGRTAVSDAAAFGQWRAARRLIERGARTTLWEAATLGLMSRVEDYFAGDRAPSGDEITRGFWGACQGGQRAAAQYLLARGADLNWIGWDRLTPLDAARRSGAHDLADWLQTRGARSAADTAC